MYDSNAFWYDHKLNIILYQMKCDKLKTDWLHINYIEIITILRELFKISRQRWNE
jgi:hypothetical protein